MDIIFSCSGPLLRWLRITPPRLHSADGKNIGTQRLTSTSSQVCWQLGLACHRPRQSSATVIAIEAWSRMTLLLPFDFPPAQETLTDTIIHHWSTTFLSLAISNNLLPDNFEFLMDKFYNRLDSINWYRNTDLSVNGHVADAIAWIDQFNYRKGQKNLKPYQATELGIHINQLLRKAKTESGKKETFVPLQRFMLSNLERFENGLVHPMIAERADRAFGDNHSAIESETEKPSAEVINLSDFASKKRLSD